jgi:hypothetical protein
MDDPYLVLRIESDAKPEAIWKQYRFLVKAFHPDRFDTPEYKLLAEEEIKKINSAYQVLSAPSKHVYDAQRKSTTKYSRSNTNDLKRKGEETARQHAQEEQKKRAETAAYQRAQEEQKKKAEAATRQRIQEEQEKLAAQEARQRAEDEANRATKIETQVLPTWQGDSFWTSWAPVLLGFLFSIPFYIVFSTVITSSILLIVAVIFFGFICATIIRIAIQERRINMVRAWIRAQDWVTNNEATVVRRIEDLQEMLTPIAKQFGKDKVPLVEKMIRKQAEIGIKRKLLEFAASESKRYEMEKTIDSLSAEIDVLRKKIGPDCMMFVREVYLEHDAKVWDAIGSRIHKSNNRKTSHES